MGAPARLASFGRLGNVCRLGLATRGNTRLEPDDVLEAIRRGVTFLNWCGHPDGLSAAVRRMSREERARVHVCAQLGARDANGAKRELDELLGELGTPYLDSVTYYYVESMDEWDAIVAPRGARDALEEARARGRLRAIGLTSHQRPLAGRLARSGELDFLMIRYNAAHRGAEREILPVTTEIGMPVVAYTGLRWGALLRPTPDDPPGFTPPPAPAWYRFVLSQPAITVALMAPNGRSELEEDLAILDDWRGLEPDEHRALQEHGARVRRHAGRFP